MTATEHPWRKAVAGLGAMLAVDGVCGALRLPFVEDCSDSVGVAEEIRWMIPASKAAAVAGLAVGMRWAPVGRATSVGLVAYFGLAVGSHVRAGVYDRNFVAACGMLGAVSAVTLPFWGAPAPADVIGRRRG